MTDWSQFLPPICHLCHMSPHLSTVAHSVYTHDFPAASYDFRFPALLPDLIFWHSELTSYIVDLVTIRQKICQSAWLTIYALVKDFETRGPCRANLHKWGLAILELCECDVEQIIDITCTLLNLVHAQSLLKLYEAVDWLNWRLWWQKLSWSECMPTVGLTEYSHYNRCVRCVMQGYFTNYPKHVFLILTNEFCERFAYYGMRGAFCSKLKRLCI